jgi:hypothetical protein
MCAHPKRSATDQLEIFTLVLLSPRENAELVLKILVALHASHAALLKITSKFSPNEAHPTRLKFRRNAALQTQNSVQTLSYFPLLHIRTAHF